jgi:hypothetical protein
MTPKTMMIRDDSSQESITVKVRGSEIQNPYVSVSSEFEKTHFRGRRNSSRFFLILKPLSKRKSFLSFSNRLLDKAEHSLLLVKMENDQDIHKVGSQFSTLNVNAVEFVPSFGMSPPQPQKDIETGDTDEPPPPVAPTKPIETTENNGNGM